MTQSPGHGKCAVHPWPGLCGMPLALRLSEGLGVTGSRALAVWFCAVEGHHVRRLDPFRDRCR
jgi:hypothetical protein